MCFLGSTCSKTLNQNTKFTPTSWFDRSTHYKLQHKFNKLHINLYHKYTKIQNKPQKQSAFPEGEKKSFCLYEAENSSCWFEGKGAASVEVGATALSHVRAEVTSSTKKVLRELRSNINWQTGLKAAFFHATARNENFLGHEYFKQKSLKHTYLKHSFCLKCMRRISPNAFQNS